MRPAQWILAVLACVPGCGVGHAFGHSDAGSDRRVVLYTSMDGDVARPILEAFTKETGVRVDAVFDTEATKTTGLVNRLLAEKDAPRADVWWSSEAFGTIRLDRAGALAMFTTSHEKDFAKAGATGGGWPVHLRSKGGTWYGVGERRRVIVRNTQRVDAADVPKTLGELINPKWKGRVAMARPQFGSTRGHMARVVAMWGEPAFERWLTAMRDNGVRLLDGNASVVRAVANGEAWVGLTDNDDVVSGLANGWTVAEHSLEDVIEAPSAGRASGDWCMQMRVPGTVAVIKGASHAEAGRQLADWLLSARTEEAMAASAFQTARLRGPSAEAASQSSRCEQVPLDRVADEIEAAMRVCGKVLK